jgi:glycosyltransferase involved in cell wall biosynthesis
MERIVLELARELGCRRVPVRVILPDEGAAGQTRLWQEAAGVKADLSPALAHAFGRRRLGGVPALRALLLRHPARVVNVHYGMNFPSLNDILAIRLAGRRCVASLHAGGGADPPPPTLRARKTRLAAALCTAIVAVSGFQAEELIRGGVPSEKISIIPNGVRPPDGFPAKADTRARLGLPADAFVVATAARLTVRKGVADLIRALGSDTSLAASQFLVIAGEGPERERLEALARRHLPGRHRFLGRVSDMDAVYAAADIFALPSYEESFGLVYAEAALRGIPSIATTVGGVPETVLDSQTGLLTPPGNPVALARALRRLHDDPSLRLRLGQAAFYRAHSEFTAGRMADAYEEVLFGAG